MKVGIGVVICAQHGLFWFFFDGKQRCWSGNSGAENRLFQVAYFRQRCAGVEQELAGVNGVLHKVGAVIRELVMQVLDGLVYVVCLVQMRKQKMMQKRVLMHGLMQGLMQV